jgi:ferric-dicitrate binding protein FerR (iron transport regulator)
MESPPADYGHHRGLLLVPLVAALALYGLPLPAAAAGAPAAGRWTLVQGRVAVAAAGGGVARAARAGEALAVGDQVEAGDDGRAQLLFADETVMNLAPGTSIRLLQYAFDPASGRRSAVVAVAAGQARFIVAARKSSRFNVETPHAAVAVTAAADFVADLSPTLTTVAVLDGVASVKNVSKLIVPEIEVHPNESASVAAKAPPSPPGPLTPRQRKAYRTNARTAR